MRKLSIIILSLLTFLSNVSLSFSNGNEGKTLSKNTGYKLYQERVELFCGEYKFDNNNSETVYLMDEKNSYIDLSKASIFLQSYQVGKDLELAKKQYRGNMDGIYECATSVTYNRSLKLLKDSLINSNPELNSRLIGKIDSKIKEVENSQKQKDGDGKNKCKLNDEKNNAIIKSSILKQTTYEICKYNFYLEYLKEFNQNIENIDESIINNPNNSIGINKVLELEKQKISRINNEINDSYKAFPIAFKAYSEYENNITIHIMLELIREEYALLREALHKSLNPINQVVYKISNAMRK